MKKLFINDIGAGDKVDDIFMLSEKNLAQKRDGNNYLNMTLSDKTGRIKGVMWDRVDEITGEIAIGDFVHIIGNVSEYRDKLQLVVKKMHVCSIDTIVPADFLPVTSRDVDTMFDRLLQLTDSIQTVYIKNLLQAFWDDGEFVNKYKTAPAAKKVHHAYVGGLLEHSLSMALLAEKIAGHYSGVDRDMLIAGTILHDIGKIREFNYKTGIDYSDEGRLMSHIVIGIQLLDEQIEQIESFPGDQALLLKHILVSHHGSKEFGSPEPPKTIEAVLVNYIDEIDSKINGIREFMGKEEPNENWTSFHRLWGRHFFIGEKRK